MSRPDPNYVVTFIYGTNGNIEDYGYGENWAEYYLKPELGEDLYSQVLVQAGDGNPIKLSDVELVFDNNGIDTLRADEFFQDLSNYSESWNAEFNIRNAYLQYGFEVNSDYLPSQLYGANHVNLFVHGFNVSADGAREFRNTFASRFNEGGYTNPNILLSWQGDIGNNSLSKLMLFNKDVANSKAIWQAVGGVTSYINNVDNNIGINAVTHSLGASTILNAAKNGVKFNTVIMLVPAIDNESISIGGEYAGAIRNIDNLVLVYSGNQTPTFTAYGIMQQDIAAGWKGVSGLVAHRNFTQINATSSISNDWGIQIDNHGDIYENETLRMLLYYLQGRRVEWRNL